MNAQLIATQVLNGLQFGILLFLMSAGLTLVFGIMNFVNLAHGSLYMMGAYLAAVMLGASDSFLLALLLAVPATMLIGLAVDRMVLAGLYTRDHLDQVLATFGLILVFNEIVRFFWGPAPVYINVPPALSGTVELFGFPYPAYRFAIIAVGLVAGLGLYVLINRTRVGMLIRAGAADAEMVGAMGVNIRLLNALIFGLGAGLAGLAGVMAGPILSVQPGMGEPVLVLTLVVIVTGGIGSIRGAFYGALLVGLIDTLGRAFLPAVFDALVGKVFAQAAGPAVASMLIYLLMALVLAMRPHGLFPVRHA
ncbi:branched-chain amino acid ABC transporter permease [Pigmentiphaga sp. GD03639]|jgi:branched-chain amino acid transport system permease protein|uniref:Branched-chain amino acid ABC transporter permease n=1 Tax=Pigmentiphaga daeguensis TaxID=414049 RepID=A0ABN1BNJ1_9BURK|nr:MULTISPECIES: branched-chain amino acid ABC transporter permease [unclassified Pigmentiphaga]MDH2235196.1 branched-chain amino acid ABC transporter permease [Pigmentiphaga sp. GD03639]OVZ63898.1 branched-chain amino acid ABC transporter permease [Pigmentiphaga sp. NML030171]